VTDWQTVRNKFKNSVSLINCLLITRVRESLSPRKYQISSNNLLIESDKQKRQAKKAQTHILIPYLYPMTIQELETWFQKTELPAAPILLNPATQINDVKQFLDSHFYPLKLNPTSKINEPLLERLLAFKLLIESNL